MYINTIAYDLTSAEAKQRSTISFSGMKMLGVDLFKYDAILECFEVNVDFGRSVNAKLKS